MKHQQSLSGKQLAVLVLPTTSWVHIERHVEEIERALVAIPPGDYRELMWTD
jgi:hypothetical protein